MARGICLSPQPRLSEDDAPELLSVPVERSTAVAERDCLHLRELAPTLGAAQET